MPDEPAARAALPEIEQNFARNIQNFRGRRGISQDGLAQLMRDRGWEKYNQMTVSRVEKGTRKVGLKESRDLADSLNMKLDELLGPPVGDDPVDELIVHYSKFVVASNRLSDQLDEWFDQLARLRGVLTDFYGDREIVVPPDSRAAFKQSFNDGHRWAGRRYPAIEEFHKSLNEELGGFGEPDAPTS